MDEEKSEEQKQEQEQQQQQQQQQEDPNMTMAELKARLVAGDTTLISKLLTFCRNVPGTRQFCVNEQCGALFI